MQGPVLSIYLRYDFHLLELLQVGVLTNKYYSYYYYAQTKWFTARTAQMDGVHERVT